MQGNSTTMKYSICSHLCTVGSRYTFATNQTHLYTQACEYVEMPWRITMASSSRTTTNRLCNNSQVRDGQTYESSTPLVSQCRSHRWGRVTLQGRLRPSPGQAVLESYTLQTPLLAPVNGCPQPAILYLRNWRCPICFLLRWKKRSVPSILYDGPTQVHPQREARK